MAGRAALNRPTEVQAGSRRPRFQFETDPHADAFVASAVEDVRRVPGEDRSDRVVAQATDRPRTTNP